MGNIGVKLGADVGDDTSSKACGSVNCMPVGGEHMNAGLVLSGTKGMVNPPKYVSMFDLHNGNSGEGLTILGGVLLPEPILLLFWVVVGNEALNIE
jgi:hypothetical protein